MVASVSPIAAMVMPRSLALERSIWTRITGLLKARSLSVTMNMPLLRAAALISSISRNTVS